MNKEDNSKQLSNEINIVKYKSKDIKEMIYTIRGKQVMLDSDVAMLYCYETKRINETVRRNIERFPESFCFQLTERELFQMRSQFATALEENEKYRNKKHLPYAFTEQGIAMLAGLLKNEIAIKVSINIMNAFVEMRRFIVYNGKVFKEIETIKGRLLEHDKEFDKVFDELQKSKKIEFKEKIFFEGQIYDAYSLIINIIRTAKKKIIIIDNYIDDTILEMLAKKNKSVKVSILTSNNSNISELDIQKFNEEYSLLEIVKTNKFHDRFILIDNKDLYHCGASLKDLGKKCFAISKMQNIEYIEKLLEIS